MAYMQGREGEPEPAPATPRPPRVVGPEEAARRGRAVAKAKAVHASKFHEARANDPRFYGIRGWADARGENRSSVSNYATGKTPCPARVDKKAREDFPQLFAAKSKGGEAWNWPRGVVE